MKELKFIHAADLHIGSPISAQIHGSDYIKDIIRECIHQSITRMVRDAIDRKVDFVILAGDLFDDENRSVKGQLWLREEFLKLKEADIKVYIVFGNHDPLDSRFAPVTWPDNVYVFPTASTAMTVEKDKFPVANLYGCSYPKKAVTENLAASYKKQDEPCFHIGILHGQERSLDSHAPYAPFTVKELSEKGMDYWALGHIHTRQSLHPSIHYPGNIQGRNKKETGEKGYLYVELKESQDPVVTFCSSAPVQFVNITLSVTDCKSVDELINKFWEKMKMNVLEEVKVYLVSLCLTGTGALSSHLSEEQVVEEMKDVINTLGETDKPFIQVIAVENETNLEWDKAALAREGHFLGDVFKAGEVFKNDPESIWEEWEELFSHPKARKFITKPDRDESREIIEKAEKLLGDAWMKE
ncbi:exonuclease SbcCD subunit D [Thalassorhabdus alkalitolerans]|uniref:Exonuclease SbcCD subunit D n=1 Tax=Thalassorhabdus alkalitolerans TaxID=2282697 RepID=A0ABW0YMC6_9BACI